MNRPLLILTSIAAAFAAAFGSAQRQKSPPTANQGSPAVIEVQGGNQARALESFVVTPPFGQERAAAHFSRLLKRPVQKSQVSAPIVLTPNRMGHSQTTFLEYIHPWMVRPDRVEFQKTSSFHLYFSPLKLGAPHLLVFRVGTMSTVDKEFYVATAGASYRQMLPPGKVSEAVMVIVPKNNMSVNVSLGPLVSSQWKFFSAEISVMTS